MTKKANKKAPATPTKAITAAATAVTFILIRERQTVHLAHIASKYAPNFIHSVANGKT